MKKLQDAWFCCEPIDFEHKQYILLDFIQSVQEDFSLWKLYPSLGELGRHIGNLEAFRVQQKFVLDRLRKPIGYSWQNNEILYENPEQSLQLREVNDIIDFAISNMNPLMNKGQALYDRVQTEMRWHTIGIVPTEYVDEGYFMIRNDRFHTSSYRYRIEKVISNEDSFWGINLRLVHEDDNRFSTYENIKNIIIRKHPEIPVPLTFAIETNEFPLEETILPIVKRIGLMRIRRGIYS
jgi:hypothetical protein